jgi:hypothetical protein
MRCASLNDGASNLQLRSERAEIPKPLDSGWNYQKITPNIAHHSDVMSALGEFCSPEDAISFCGFLSLSK